MYNSITTDGSELGEKVSKKSESSIIKRHFDVIDLVKRKPSTVKELIEQTGLRESTMYDMLNRLIRYNKLKKIGHKYADKEYNLLEEKIEKFLRCWIISYKALKKVEDKKQSELGPTGENVLTKLSKIMEDKSIHINSSDAKKVATELEEDYNDNFITTFNKVCHKLKIKINYDI